MRNITLFFALIFLPALTYAQTSETIVSSRPGQAFAPNVTGTNVFQIQSGFSIGESSFGTNQPIDNNIFIHNTLLRYGLSELFEIRASVTIENSRSTSTLFDPADPKGVSDLSLGARYVLLDGENRAGKLSLQADIGLPLRTGSFSSNDDLSYQLLLIQTYSIFTENLALNVNLGLISSAFGDSPDGKYVINLSHPLGGRSSVFIENYGFLSGGDIDTFFDGGFAFLMNNNFQLDLSAGFGNNGSGEEKSSSWFVDTGISIRFQ